MNFQQVLHDLDRISEELGIITNQNEEFIYHIYWEKGENNELTVWLQTFKPLFLKCAQMEEYKTC